MSRLRNKSEILYFDPPVSMIAPLKDKKPPHISKNTSSPAKKSRDTKTSLCTHCRRYRRFSTNSRWINKINQKRQAAFIRERCASIGFGDETVLWCYFAVLVRHCGAPAARQAGIRPCRPVIPRTRVTASIPRLWTRWSTIWPSLPIRYSRNRGRSGRDTGKVNPTTQMIPNGAAYEIFSRVQTEKDTLPCPEDMKDLPHPIYGFVGMLQECTDYALIEKLAKSRPNATIFLIGRTPPSVDLTNLKQYPNIVFHGLVPQPELPAYLAQMDVCLNVFRAGAPPRTFRRSVLRNIWQPASRSFPRASRCRSKISRMWSTLPAIPRCSCR